MSPDEIHAFLAASARPAEDVIAAAPKPEPYVRNSGRHGMRTPKARARGWGVCTKCRQVGLTREVHGRLWCARCP